MRHFDYTRPASLAEAVEALRERGEGAHPLGGGTDLLVQVKEGGRRPSALISLAGIPELTGIHLDASGELRVGARTTMQQVADDTTVQQRFSALADGASVVGSYQTRNMATIGGNVCNAAPSADTSPPLVVLGARAHIAGVNGEREQPVEELWDARGVLRHVRVGHRRARRVAVARRVDRYRAQLLTEQLQHRVEEPRVGRGVHQHQWRQRGVACLVVVKLPFRGVDEAAANARDDMPPRSLAGALRRRL